uniref:Uncharacterized protein n=1 Tax=Rhizophora mucronata TaxID=61149 RepID=A0A2P2PSK1_RHIMU
MLESVQRCNQWLNMGKWSLEFKLKALYFCW